MPRRREKPRLAGLIRRLPIAIAVAVVMWFIIQPAYNPLLAWGAQTLARMTEYPRAAQIRVIEDAVVVGRVDLRADSALLQISITEIQFNLIPFLALVFALPRWQTRGGWKGLFLAFCILAISHVFGLFFHAKVFYATRLGSWSVANYSNFARMAYGGLKYFFQIAVTFALPLVLWWAFFSKKIIQMLELDWEQDLG